MFYRLGVEDPILLLLWLPTGSGSVLSTEINEFKVRKYPWVYVFCCIFLASCFEIGGRSTQAFSQDFRTFCFSFLKDIYI